MSKVKTICKITLFTLLSVLFSVLIIGTRTEAAGKVHALVISGIDDLWHDGGSSYTSSLNFYKALKGSRIPDYLIEDSHIRFRSWKNADSHYLANGEPFTSVNFERWLDISFNHHEANALNIFYYGGHTTLDCNNDLKSAGIKVGPENDKYVDYVYLYSKLAQKLATYEGHFIVILDSCFAEIFYNDGVKNNGLQSKFTCILSTAESKRAHSENTLIVLPSKKQLFTSRMVKGTKWNPLTLNGDGKVYNADYNTDGVLDTTELFTYAKSLFINAVQAPKLYPENGKAYPLIQLDTVSSISKTSATLWVGDGIKESYSQVKLVPFLEKYSGKVGVQYVSSDRSIASVGKTTGIITAKSAGTANITAYLVDKNGNRCFGTEKKCKVTVKQASTSLNKNSIRVNKNTPYQLKATVTGPSNKVTWKSSDKSVAKVSSDGLVTGVKVGTTTIIATANGIPAKCKVTVVDIPSDAKVYNKHYYKFYNKGCTWTEARDICKKKGGHLVTVTSNSEYSFCKKILGNRCPKYCWMGASRSSGSWKWVTGEAWDFTHWSPSQPNGSGGGTYALMQNYPEAPDPWNWDDQGNSGTSPSSTYSRSPYFQTTDYYSFICEWEPLSS